MSDALDRRKFLKMTGAAGFGIGLLSQADLLNAKPSKAHAAGQPAPARVQPEGPYSTRFEWSGEDLWQRAVTNRLRYNNGVISLDDHILVEDDAPAIGTVQSHVWERIQSGTVLEKHLQIDRWPVQEALITMLVYPVQPRGPMSGGKLEFRVNGNDPIIYEVNHFWTSVPVPAGQLRLGSNRILVTVHGSDTVFRTPIALAGNYKYGSLTRTAPSPQRSRRSDDRGSTWTTGLGADGQVSGEYPIRLTLRSRQPEGWLQTPVIDLSNSPGPFHQPAVIEQARIDLQVARRGESSVVVQVRSGETHRPEAGGWSDWEQIRSEELPSSHRKRFVQVRVNFGSQSGDATPRLESLRVEGRVRPRTEERSVFFLDGLNRPLIDKPHPFEHEDPMVEELQAFRKRYDLDKIVKGARNELELVLKLNNWAAGNWNWHMPPADQVPDVIQWNANHILNPVNESQEPGGYCLLYSVVLAQACQSFGIPARMVNINYAIFGGHEVIEVWSREYEKWYMVDPNFDSIFIWKESGEPMSVLELHDIFRETYYPGGEIIDRDAWSYEERDRRSHRVDPEELPIEFRTDGHAMSGELGNDYVWWKVTDPPKPGYAGGYGFFNTAYVRWIPRSNWLSQPYPMPITHGRTHWGWDGYLAWTDEQTPRTQEHRHFLRKEQEIYDRLFTVDYSAQPLEEGAVRVHLATDSPGFSHFELVDATGRRSTTRSASFRWELARGVNRLEMRSVDVLGNRGPASELTVNYMPQPA